MDACCWSRDGKVTHTPPASSWLGVPCDVTLQSMAAYFWRTDAKVGSAAYRAAWSKEAGAAAVPTLQPAQIEGECVCGH